MNNINNLIEQYKGDIIKIANNRFNYYKFSESLRDDFIQECFINFDKYINTYDEKYKISNYIFLICNTTTTLLFFAAPVSFLLLRDFAWDMPLRETRICFAI